MSSVSSKNGNKTKLIILAVILCVLIVASVAVAVVVALGEGNPDNGKENSSASGTASLTSEQNASTQNSGLGSDITDSSSVVVNSSYEVIAPDADAYYNGISTVVSKTEAFTSVNVRTESQVYNDFFQRGFTEDITTEYMMNGDLDEKRVISRYSSLTHPVYQTYYTTAKNDLWLIVEINGTVMATPVTYNLSLNSGMSLMLSENDTMTTYDSTSNQFYVIKPKADEITLKTVGAINAQTLENYQLGGNQ